jgi:hypothetical protein
MCGPGLEWYVQVLADGGRCLCCSSVCCVRTCAQLPVRAPAITASAAAWFVQYSCPKIHVVTVCAGYAETGLGYHINRGLQGLICVV